MNHDVKDRRQNNMVRATEALAGCVADLTMFAEDPAVIAGVAYSVADRISRLIVELEQFKARDLLNLREQAVSA